MLEYFHGFEESERQRLLQQAEVLAPLVYENVDFSQSKSILEIGCGVGAQTLQLLKRFPHLKITCVELSEKQLQSAQVNLKDYVTSGQVKLLHATGEKIPIDEKFDGAFFCWVLEHVGNTLTVLKEASRLLKTDSPIYLREVFNTILFADPPVPRLMQIWKEYNDRQIEMGGDPYVGAKLGLLLSQSGFKEINLRIRTHVYDERTPRERLALLEYWEKLFLSGISNKIIEEEFEKLRSNPQSIFAFGFAEAMATKLQDPQHLLEF